MRVDNPAPVDTMGCERTADDTASPEVREIFLVKYNINKFTNFNRVCYT